MPLVLRKNESVDGEEHALGTLLHDKPHNAAAQQPDTHRVISYG